MVKKLKRFYIEVEGKGFGFQQVVNAKNPRDAKGRLRKMFPKVKYKVVKVSEAKEMFR